MCWFRLNSAGYLFARLIFYVSRFTSYFLFAFIGTNRIFICYTQEEFE
jgi:hypothetical protein